MDHLIHRVNKPGEGPAPFDDGLPVPDLPAHLYVTVAELAAELGVTDLEATWLEPACVTATAAVDQYIGPDGVARWLTGPTYPDPVRLAALTVAVDVYRRRTAAAGYFAQDDYLARLPLDPTVSIGAHLAPYVLDLGIG